MRLIDADTLKEMICNWMSGCVILTVYGYVLYHALAKGAWSMMNCMMLTEDHR